MSGLQPAPSLSEAAEEVRRQCLLYVRDNPHLVVYCAFADYACELYHPFVEDVHAAFPRKIQDTVWSYLEESEQWEICEVGSQLKAHLVSPDSEIRKREREPWLFSDAFMGIHAREELLERVYKKVFSRYNAGNDHDPCYIGLTLLHNLAVSDRISAGLLPVQLLRSLHMTIDGFEIASRLRDPEYEQLRPRLPTWRSCFATLLQVPKMQNFDFKLRIRSCHLCPTTFDHMLEMFRPVYKKLNSAEATVVLEYAYAYKGKRPESAFRLDGILCSYSQGMANERMEQNRGQQPGKCSVVYDDGPEFLMNMKKADAAADREFDDAVRAGRIKY